MRGSSSYTHKCCNACPPTVTWLVKYWQRGRTTRRKNCGMQACIQCWLPEDFSCSGACYGTRRLVRVIVVKTRLHQEGKTSLSRVSLQIHVELRACKVLQASSQLCRAGMKPCQAALSGTKPVCHRRRWRRQSCPGGSASRARRRQGMPGTLPAGACLPQ